MKVYVYKNNGFCNGVKNAIDVAIKAKGERVFTYGEIVHNKRVLNELSKKGIEAVERIDELKEGDTLIIRAHGATKSVFDECNRRKIKVEDATCKYVKAIQQKAADYYKRGYQIIIVGDRNHPEVKGINGWCENSAIITDGESRIKIEKCEKALILFQTTFMASKIEKSLKNIITDCVKTLEVFRSICYTTVDRQSFVDYAVSVSECVMVVGDESSSNTKKLLELAKSCGRDAYLVEDAADVNKIELSKYKNISIIAGASTPKELTEEVLSKMFESAKDDVVEVVENTTEVVNEVEVNKEVVKAVKENDTAEQTQEQEKAQENEEVTNETEEAEHVEGNEFTQAVEKLPIKYKPLRAGQKIKGTVSHIGSDGVSVSFGSKRDGFIPNEELSLDGDYAKVKEAMTVGENLEVIVLSTDKNVMLSKKSVDEIYKDDALVDEIKDGAEFSVEITKAVKGGLLSKLGSYIVFIPASHIRSGYVKNLDQYLGKKLRLIALDIDHSKRKIVASQRDLLVRERQAKEDNFWNNIEVGEIVEGKVMRFATFGAFVNIRGFDCLAHLSDLSWNNIKEPSEVLELNKTYEFVVLKLDRTTNRVSVGYKQLQPHPWSVAAEKYAVGTIHQGKVARLLPYGAFVELDKGIDGLLHISNVSWDWIGDISTVLKVGDIIDVCVMDFNVENKRITLSRKATIEQPTIPVEEKNDNR
ncbi:MAG: 4-hydroxy-3-methylbut-2-enyl diphosphate reductase [Clostridia bacterium]